MSDFDDWKRRVNGLVDEAVAAGPLEKLSIFREATDEQAGFKLTIVWPGQQRRKRKARTTP